MVIVVVKDYRGAGGLIEAKGAEGRSGKRHRAVPPEGWVGESSAPRKRSVGERMEAVTKYFARRGSRDDSDGGGKTEKGPSGKRSRSSRSTSKDKDNPVKDNDGNEQQNSADPAKDGQEKEKESYSSQTSDHETEIGTQGCCDSDRDGG